MKLTKAQILQLLIMVAHKIEYFQAQGYRHTQLDELYAALSTMLAAKPDTKN